jgi:hypothetical protein
LDPRLGILKHQALFRGDAEATSGFQERIRVRFAAQIILTADNRLEEVANSERL